MVAAGMQTGGVGTDSIEVIDLESSTTNCSSIPVFPYIVYAPFGGLSFQRVPFICGGSSSIWLYESRCYTLVTGIWNKTYTLTEGKRCGIIFLQDIGKLTISRDPHRLLKISRHFWKN